MDSTVKKGKVYEDYVSEYLLQRGYQILSRNFRSKRGEIDLIVGKNKNIRFVEVKGQRINYESEHKINKLKKARIERTSIDYIRKNHLWAGYSFHYDVAIVTGTKVHFYPNAFEGENEIL